MISSVLVWLTEQDACAYTASLCTSDARRYIYNSPHLCKAKESLDWCLGVIHDHMDHSRLSVNFGYDSENPGSQHSLWRTAVSAGPSVNRPFLHKPLVLQVPLSSKAT